ncbi:MAG: integrase arm-type DNA-binding domain-containing protein [Rhodomicrobium sp.]
MPLSDTTIMKAKPAEKPYKLTDERGLFLLVSPVQRSEAKKASKLWRLRYRFAGKEKLLALGSYPEISLAEARKRRDIAREMLARQIDPGEARKKEKREGEKRAANSFKAVAEKYVNAYSNRWSSSYTRDVRHRLTIYVFPDLGERPIAEIEAPELLDVLRKIECRGTYDILHRMHRLCGQVFRYGVANGLCGRDPAADLRGALTPHKVKHMAAVTPKELPQLLHDIEAYDGEIQTKLGLKLLALTFTRTKELIGAEWSEIDWNDALWTVPAQRMKRVHGISLDHLVPLARQVIDILQELKALNAGTGGRFIFLGRNQRQHISTNTLLYGLYRLGYHSRMTGHGFRSVASTILNETRERGEHSFSAEVIERQLGHEERDDVRAAYNRAQHLIQRRAMMQWWADHLDTLRRKVL